MSDGLGVWLRRARETRQIALTDAEQALRIRRQYLQALEMGDYAALPGEIQARGFLRNYARYLNLPVDEALARYDAEIHGRPMQPRIRTATAEPKVSSVERPSVFSPPPTEEQEIASPRARVPSVVLQGLFVALIFFFIVLTIAFVWLQLLDDKSVTATLTPGVTMTTVSAASETPAIPTVFPVSADGKVHVRLSPNQNAWISISADSAIVFQGIATPSQVLEATAGEMLIVATGNAGAFTLYLNGTDWGLLGDNGVAVRRAWSPVGEVSLEP